ncbi:MAG TPA: NYN domain-containing protein [Anaerolineales bacterium]|nr:NYN domain-containing protein [Anaerolineales bacterium]
MHYLIDGHNLVPHIPGLHLGMIDDEERLLKLVQAYCSRGGHQADVYFDNAPPGQPPRQPLGRLVAHFVRQGQIADEAIGKRLVQLGPRARQCTVVSTDQRVMAAGRAAHARVMRSEEFARQLLAPPARASEDAERAKLAPDADEVEEWLRIFQEYKPRK